MFDNAQTNRSPFNYSSNSGTNFSNAKSRHYTAKVQLMQHGNPGEHEMVARYFDSPMVTMDMLSDIYE